MISSMYMKHWSGDAPAKANAIIRAKELGLTFSPKGRTFHLNDPPSVLKDVMSREFSSNGIW